MADRVRERLLRDPVQRKLHCRGETKGVHVDAANELDFGARVEHVDQSLESVGEPEIVEHGRAQLTRDPADLVEILTGQRLRLRQSRLEARRRLLHHILQLEQERGQALPHLIVQLGRDPPPLLFQTADDTRATRTPLELEPIEHLVERPDYRTQLERALDIEPLPRPEQINPPHQLGEVAQRRETNAQQDGVGGQDREQAQRQYQRLIPLHRKRNRRRRHREHDRGDDQKRRVDRKHPPKERRG